MKRKTRAAEQFIDGLMEHIEENVLLNRNTRGKREAAIQGGLYPLIAGYVMEQLKARGIKNFEKLGGEGVYWGGQSGSNEDPKMPVFSARNYPDFAIRRPYRIAIEYKQGETGALMKQCIGQGLMHVVSGDYDFVLLLFDDQTKNKTIRNSMQNLLEQALVARMWNDFNIKMKIL